MLGNTLYVYLKEGLVLATKGKPHSPLMKTHKQKKDVTLTAKSYTAPIT